MTMSDQEIRESVTLESRGLKLFGILHIPKHVSRPPVVFFCHGLAGNKIGKDRIYVEIAYALSLAGIASFRMDCRGSGDSEGLFADVLPEDFVEDTLIGLNYLSELMQLDKDRIGIYARSFGGPVGVEAAAKFGKIKSLVLWCPMFSGEQWLDQWQLLLTKTISEEKASEMMRINGQQGSSAFFEQFMGINIEESLKRLADVPLLHIHGEEDRRVTLQHAEEYARVRKENGTTNSNFIRLAHTDHDFSNYTEKLSAIKSTVDWYSKTLIKS
jgi:alpha-beta hydrolase superfamily lysophospholipase